MNNPLWHPHTEYPERLCSCLIALPGNPHNPRGEPPILAADLYVFDPLERAFRNERTQSRLEHDEFWWAREIDVLIGLNSA